MSQGAAVGYVQPSVATTRFMKLKRQLFLPGRRIRQIGSFAQHPFFSRRNRRDEPLPASPASASVVAVQKRGVLPTLAENAGALFSLIVSAMFIMVIVALSFAFIREIRRDTLQIESFAAPKDLVERGYTSPVIAEQILGEIHKVQGSLVDTTATRRLEVASALPDFQVAAGGLSMKSVVRYARALVNLPDNRISGEILRDGTSLRLVLRMYDNAKLHVEEVVRQDGNVDLLLAQAGQIVAKESDPVPLAEYLYRKERGSGFAETVATIDYILTHPPATDDWRAYNLLGDVRAAQGRTGDAVQAYNRALILQPDSVGIRGNIALALEAAGRRDEAAVVIQEGLRLSGIDSRRLFQFGYLMFYLNRYDEMLEVSRRAVKADPTNASAYGLLAIALGRKHRPEESLRAYAQGRGLAKSLDFDGNWGGIETQSLIDLGRVDDAFRIANARAIAYPENSWHRYSRALAAAAMGRHVEAISVYPQLLIEDLPPGDVRASWATSLLALGDIEAANAQYLLSIGENSRRAVAHQGLGRVRVARRDYLGSLPAFAEAIRLDADDASIRRDRAAALEALGRSDDAGKDIAAAAEIEVRLARPLPPP